MIPVLYKTITEGTVPADYGVGALSDCLLAEVNEARNGEYELTLEYAAGGIHAEDLETLAIIKAKPNYTDDPQLFEVYHVGKVMNGRFTVNARHISYRLSNRLITTGSAGSCAAACALLDAQAGNFTITTDKATTAAFRVSEPSSVRSWFGGKSGSLLDVYGGEWKYNNFTASLLNARGMDRGASIRYGKNLTELSQEISTENLATAILPFYKDDDGNITAGAKVYTGLTLNPPREIAVDFSNDVDPESATPILSQLATLANRYIENNNFTVAVNSIKLNFAQLEDLTERVDLCDTVHIYFEALGITATAKCINTVWDVLQDRYKSCTFGNARPSIADTITAQANELKEIKANYITAPIMQAAIGNATALITGNSGGYVVIHDSNGDGEPDEILVMNTPDISTATKVWRWNKNGLGYSSNGYAGPFGLAMTADGAIVADFITAGTMSGNRVRTGLISSVNGQLIMDLDNGTITAPQIILNGENVGDRLAELEQVSVVTAYALSNSGTVIPASFPLNAPAQPTEQQPYLWSRTIYTYADGETNTSYTISVRGANGADGQDGHGLNILGNYDTMADLIAAHPTGNAGDVYMVGGDLVVWDTSSNSWHDIGRIQGPSGFDGLWLAIENDDTGSNMNVTYTAKLFKGVTDVTTTYDAVFVWQMVKESGITELAANTPTVTVARDTADYGGTIRCICICIMTEEDLQDYAYATIQDYSGNDIQIIGQNVVKLIGENAVYKPYAISSEFQVLQDEISARVTQTAFNSLENTVTTQGTLIQQNAQAILLKADTTTVNAGLNNKMGKDMSNRASSILIDSGQIRFDSNSLVVNSSQFTLDANGNASFGGNLSAATLVIGDQPVAIGDAISDAETDAITAAAADATNKANAAQSNAITAAASDATTKANNAKNTAISTAASDATTKANNAQTTAINTSKNYTDTGLAGKVGNDEVRTKFAVDTHSVTIESGTVKFKSNTLLVDSTQFTLDAQGNATFKGNLSAATLVIGGSTTNIGTAINNAQSNAISTASADATTKANNAKSQAISTAASDATTKANAAQSNAITAAASDATTKANNALTSANNYTDTGLAGKVGNNEIRTKFAADTHSVTIASGTIGFTSNTLKIDSDNFQLSANGSAKAKNFDAITSFNLLNASGATKARLVHNAGSGVNFTLLNEAGQDCGGLSCNSGGGTVVIRNSSEENVAVLQPNTNGSALYLMDKYGDTRAHLWIGGNLDGVLDLFDNGGAVTITAAGQSGLITCNRVRQTNGLTSLYNGTFTSGSVTFSAAFSAFVIVGSVKSGGSKVTSTIPVQMLSASDTGFQLADNDDYISFKLKISGNTATMTYSNRSSSGAIEGVYGML